MISPQQRNDGSPRILLVEDDDAVRRSLQLLLRSQGYDVRAYASAVGVAGEPEALRASCLVADLLMPQKDALELLDELRAAGWWGSAILISGHLTDEWDNRAREGGYDRVLKKPIVEQELRRAVAELIARPGV